MLPENLGHLFDVPLHLQPTAPALLQDDVVLAFGDLEERCNRMANALASLGVQPGHRIALMFSNDYRFVESLLGAMRVGAVPVPLNIRMGDEAIIYVIADSEAVVLIANSDMADRARRLAPQVPGVRHFIFDGEETGKGLNYNQILQASSHLFARRKTAPDEVCMQPYTSGSTGKPKGVLLTHGGQIWNTDLLCKLEAFDDRERALVAVPLYHKNAMLGAVKPMLLCGGSLVILPAFDPVQVIRSIARYKVTYMTGVPAMFSRILSQKEELRRNDVKSLRYAVCGSAEVSEELVAEFQRTFPEAIIAESYGLTEGGPDPISNCRYGLIKRGSCGRQIPGSDVKIVGEDGVTELSPNEVGELITRNPGLAKGYWKLPEVTKKKFRDGWLYTGDLMRRDEDGFFYFVGRKDDMINVSGENVYPKEIVDILLRHPNVRDAYVIPVRHPIKGAVPVAFIVQSQAGRTSAEEIKQFYLKHGAPYAYPRYVHFLDSMPLGGTGKVDRAQLAKLAEEFEEKVQHEPA
ncbi:MAG TPA: class I adenylate-forming enzyme family protein [Candidatus Cybelea sp.]|nr:class I adenylate-forming enzyme family protein [Candidatus Cybelea sp.]